LITILGASGFIGSHLVRHLRENGIEHQAPARHERLAGRNLGHIIYCIGLTGDFRDRPFDAVEAHVSKLVEIVRTAKFESILYLSSIRLYRGSERIARETDELRFNPSDFEDIYTLSKATGEAVVLALGPKGRVARISNVYGAEQRESFLGTIVQEAILISIGGILFGILGTVILKYMLAQWTTLTVAIIPHTVLMIVFVGLLSGVIGALYPGLRAARLDAVDALNYD